MKVKFIICNESRNYSYHSVMNNNVLWQTKRRRIGGGVVGERFGKNTPFYHTHQHFFLRYFHVNGTLQVRMVEHGLSTEAFLFLRQFDSALASFACDSEKRKELFSLFPHPHSLQLADNKSLVLFIAIRALGNT